MMEFSSTLENQPIFRFLTFGVDAGLCFFLKLFLGSTVNYFPHPQTSAHFNYISPHLFQARYKLGPYYILDHCEPELESPFME